MTTAGFDIETVKQAPPGNVVKEPLGITCIGLAIEGDAKGRVWHPERTEDGDLDRKMDVEHICSFIDFLWDFTSEEGQELVSWNGLSFDFQVLAVETRDCEGYFEKCVKLALTHIDAMFAFFQYKGYPLSLSAAAKGVGVGRKHQGIAGAEAPLLWRRGLEQQKRVLAYVLQDAKLTVDVYRAMVNTGYLEWSSRSGRKQLWILPERKGRPYLPKVEGIIDSMTPPDNSWMDKPIFRESFHAWLSGSSEEATMDGTLELDLNDENARLAAEVYAHLIATTDKHTSDRILKQLNELH
jgi:hypothetical protein